MVDKKDIWVISIYVIWAVITFILTFSNENLANENLTHIFLIIFFILQLTFYFLYIRKKSNFKNNKFQFIILGAILASIVEGFYMFSLPVFDSLIINSQTSLLVGLKNYFIDLIFTIPAYLIIFTLIWIFINKYQYKLWEYFIFFSLGQALGDGGFFFFSNPFALVFLPYVMLNYHSMNLLPYLLSKNNLSGKNKSFMKYIIPPLIILVTYIISGILINVVGDFFGFT